MSGDNIHGKQPVKFYSDELTHTKLSLLDMKLKPLYSDREYALILDALELILLLAMQCIKNMVL